MLHKITGNIRIISTLIVPNGVERYRKIATGLLATTSDRQRQVFDVVTKARDAAAAKVISTVGAGKRIAGWEVDRASRDFIESKGFGEYFIHRTGHSISSDIHSNGANMDDLEVHDVRQILPNSCFSIEPGVYLPEFGVRSEINILVRQGSAEVTGKIQREIVMV